MAMLLTWQMSSLQISSSKDIKRIQKVQNQTGTNALTKALDRTPRWQDSWFWLYYGLRLKDIALLSRYLCGQWSGPCRLFNLSSGANPSTAKASASNTRPGRWWGWAHWIPILGVIGGVLVVLVGNMVQRLLCKGYCIRRGSTSATENWAWLLGGTTLP